MNLVSAASQIYNYCDIPTFGDSDIANYNNQEKRKIHLTLLTSDTYFRNQIFHELTEATYECRNPGWDGHDALPVRPETFYYANQFLTEMPEGTQQPTIGVEPDGQIAVEWYRSPHYTISVSISPEGDLHYAALIGSSKAYGTERLHNGVPMIIINLINRIFTQ